MNLHICSARSSLAAAICAGLAACATVPPPTEQLAASRAAIEAAETAGASKSAPSELAQARDKLSAAQVAANNHDSELARRLAEESQVDAQLAQAKASAAQAREGLTQAENALRGLREETTRTPPPSSAPATVTPPR